jgi:riboflavin synthase
VDNTGVVTEKYMDGESLRVRMRAPPDLAPYILKKGYIAIDGTSLTITEADPTTGIFAVMLVPHTQSKIVLPDRTVGDRVNLGRLSADRRSVLSIITSPFLRDCCI